MVVFEVLRRGLQPRSRPGEETGPDGQAIMCNPLDLRDCCEFDPTTRSPCFKRQARPPILAVCGRHFPVGRHGVDSGKLAVKQDMTWAFQV